MLLTSNHMLLTSSCMLNSRCVYIHTYTHTYIHTYIHPYIHTSMHRYNSLSFAPVRTNIRTYITRSSQLRAMRHLMEIEVVAWQAIVGPILKFCHAWAMPAYRFTYMLHTYMGSIPGNVHTYIHTYIQTCMHNFEETTIIEKNDQAEIW